MKKLTQNIEKEKPEQKTKEKLTQNIIPFSIGLTIGVFTFFIWEHLVKYASFLLTILVSYLIAFCILFVYFIYHYLKRPKKKIGESIKGLSNKLKLGIEEPHKIPDLQKEAITDIEPLMSGWYIYKIGSLLAIVIAAMLGGIITIQQNVLFEKQNEIINAQNQIQEAARRTGLGAPLEEILNKIDDEIALQIKEFPDTNLYSLSNKLIIRIYILSKALMPYKIFEDGRFREYMDSPERKQLSIYLRHCKLDTTTLSLIIRGGNFNYSDFTDANLKNTDLREASLSNAIFKNTDFTEAKLIKAYLKKSDFTNANLINANLAKADLTDAIFIGTDFTGANLNKVKGLKAPQLEKAKTLYGCKNLDDGIKTQLKECLFTKEGC